MPDESGNYNMDKEFNISRLSEEFEKVFGEEEQYEEETSFKLDEGERREIAILFLDIVGFTKLAEEMDPEELKVVVSSTLKVLTGVIKKFGGTVEKYIGDAICALYGRSETHEDDSERAVSAALSIIEKLEDINAILSPKGISLHVRIGLNRGTIVTGNIDEHDTVTGEALNIAQRLEAAAPEDGVLASEEIWKGCSDKFEGERLPPLQVKNKILPVQAFRAIRKLPEKFISEFKGGFVGRKKELAELEEGSSVFFKVLGPAGIGKTRLIEEFIKKKSGQNTVVLRGHAASFGTEPYHVFVDIIKDHLRQSQVNIEGLQSELLKDYVIYLKDICNFNLSEEESAKLGSMDPKARQIETKLAMKRFIHHLHSEGGAKRNIIIFLDNLQWLSPSSKDTLAWLAANLENDLPVTFILSSRPPLELNISDCKMMELGKLSPDHIKEMIAGSGLKLEQDDIGRMVAQADGNPFYLTEMIASIGGPAKVGLKKKDLPSSVRSLVMSRFDNLQKSERYILQMASCAKSLFSLAMAKDITNRLKYSYPTDDLISALERGGFIRRTNGHFSFSQIITEEVIYDTILNVNKEKLHRLVAEWIEASSPEKPVSYLAEQWNCAGDANKAVNYYISAGRDAEQKYANREAIIFLERARTILSNVGEPLRGLPLAGTEPRPYEKDVYDERIYRIYCDLAALYEFTGEQAKWNETIEEGLKVAPANHFHYQLRLSKAIYIEATGDTDLAKKEFEELLAEDGLKDFSEMKLKMTIAQWQLMQISGLDCKECMDKTLRLAPNTKNPRVQLQVEQCLFNFYKNANDLIKAEGYLDTITRIQRSLDPFNGKLADLFYASFYWDKQDKFDEIESLMAATISYFKEIGWQKGLGMSVFYRAAALWRLGRTGEAEALITSHKDEINDADTAMRLKLVMAALLLAQKKTAEYERLKEDMLSSEKNEDIRNEIERQLTVFEGQYIEDTKRLEKIYNYLERTEKSVSSGVDEDEHKIIMAMVLKKLGRMLEARSKVEEIFPRIEHNQKKWFKDICSELLKPKV